MMAEMTAYPRAPLACRSWQLPDMDAAEGEHRQRSRGASLAQGSQPDGGAEGGFRRGGEDRAEGDEVGAGFGGRGDFRRVMGGDADQAIRAEQAADNRGGEGVAAEVDAVGVHGQGDIDAIVDQQPCPVTAGEGAKFRGQWQQLGSREIFLPQLHSPHAAAQGGLDGFGQGSPRWHLVPVGDQVEGEIDEWSWLDRPRGYG